MANRTIWTPKKEEKFLAKLIDTGGNVSAACKTVNVARSTAYHHKSEKEAFSRLWDEAIDSGTDDLEAEARRRAYEGTKKPVFYKGKPVGHIQEYSDTLMIFLLKGNRPEKYKDRQDVNLTGQLGVSWSDIVNQAKDGKNLTDGDKR